MSARSRFLHERVRLSLPKRRFERWLLDQGYEAASEMYPGAVEVTALVDEYLRECPEHALMKILIDHHAKAIGWVSDYVPDEADEEESETQEET